MDLWQGALRDETEAIHSAISEAVTKGALTVDLLYLHHEGGQRMVSQFTLIRREDESESWWVVLARRHNVDER